MRAKESTMPREPLIVRSRTLLSLLAVHVVKFADGSYLTPNLDYRSRVGPGPGQQRYAMRWLTWASAKMIADSDVFVGKGARAVRLVRRREK
jgi:hypothetical protein